jgi:MFS family permease
VANLLRQRQVRDLVLAGLCAQAGAYALVAVFAPHVQQLMIDPSATASWIGGLQAATWGAALCGAPWWGRRNDQRPIEQTFALAACGCALSITLQAWMPHVLWLLPLRLLQGFCFSALLQSVYLRVSHLGTTQSQGVQIGVTNTFLTFGQVLGSLSGALFAGFLDPHWTFPLIAGSFAVSAALAWRNLPMLEPSYERAVQ